jgi:hypothetical protein
LAQSDAEVSTDFVPLDNATALLDNGVYLMSLSLLLLFIRDCSITVALLSSCTGLDVTASVMMDLGLMVLGVILD